MEQKNKEFWEIEFDKLFKGNLSLSEDVFQKSYERLHILPTLKSFISSTLERYKREVVKELEEMYRGQRKLGADLTSFQPRVDDMDFGWNDAVAKAISLITETE